MHAEFDSSDSVVLVTGATGALGSSVVDAFADAGATVCATARHPPGEDTALDPGGDFEFYRGDFADSTAAREVVDAVVSDHGRLDALLCIAGTWRGGDPVEDTDPSTFDLLFDVNLKTVFLAAKHALPHLQETEGSMVAVSARSSFEGGSGDALYRASKAGVRLLVESIAAENEGTVRANAVVPSVIDTPANREMMPDADHGKWVDPADIAAVVLFLCSDAAAPTSGAVVPVYGEA